MDMDIKLVTPRRLELLLPPWKGGVLTAWPRGLVKRADMKRSASHPPDVLMAPQAGFEPATYRLTAECSTVELLRIIKTPQRPILPGSYPPSTFGAGRLYFCVRYGNRCGPSAIVARLINYLIIIAVINCLLWSLLSGWYFLIILFLFLADKNA